MANPRDTVNFDGIGSETSTVKIDGSTITYDVTKANGSAQVGLAVTMSADKTVALTADGDPVAGKLLKVEAGGFATIQHAGGMKLPAGASANVTAGRKIVGALGASSAKGYIRGVAAAAGSFAQATMQDALNGRGMIMDSSVSTAVQVIL